MGLRLNYETYSFYIPPCSGLQSAVAQYAAKQCNIVVTSGLLIFHEAKPSEMEKLQFTERLHSAKMQEQNEFNTCFT